MYARSFIDGLEFARNGEKISGEAPLAKMPRLLDVLENSAGILAYTVSGGVDRQGISYLDVNISGNCWLRCQRCLGALEHDVKIETRLLLRDQAGLDALDEIVAGGTEEEFDSILAESTLDVLNLLEEEILLSLPIAPKHESGVCRATDGKSEHGDESHPFAALAKLRVVK